MTSRRAFLRHAASGAAAVVASAGVARAQRGLTHDSSVIRDSTNLFAMDQMAAQPVRLPPKPGATPQLTDAQRDELEHKIHCQCGCTLDVFTCRTTDFSCQVSPAMHRDVMEMVKGGHSAQEIIDAFVGVYGERALMAPRKSGFNLLAWFAPGVSVLVGGVAVLMLLRRWRAKAPLAAAAGQRGIDPAATDATPDELARLAAAVKGDGDA